MRGSLDSGPVKQPPLSVWIGTAAGTLIGLVAFVIAIVSAGAGHGDYVGARALFPIPMLLTLLQGNSIGPLSMVLAMIQFPLYGAFLSAVARERATALSWRSGSCIPWPLLPASQGCSQTSLDAPCPLATEAV